MNELPDDLCPRPPLPSAPIGRPHSTPIYLSSVWECESPDEASAMLAGEVPGYVYQRDRHPNADVLAEQFRRLHGAEVAAVTSSGMAALSLVLVSQLQAGDHVVVSDRVYGRSATLLVNEAARFGVAASVADTCDLAATAAAMNDRTRIVLCETITNPTLRVPDLAALAKLAHERGALLVVDNTFATPAVCRPLALGADLVFESLTKLVNGHSDVMLGALCGPARLWERMPGCSSSWGLHASPFDCWLATRGLATLHLRLARAAANARAAAEFLEGQTSKVERVDYPTLASHPDQAIALRQFGDCGSWVVTFHLRGGLAAAEQFIRAAKQIPFCPSLGELATTLSHPESTSHRGLTPAERAALGISGGTIRLSCGIESEGFVLAAIAEGLK